MKNIAYSVIIVLFITACGGGSSVEQIDAKIDKIKKDIKSKRSEITGLEDELELLKKQSDSLKGKSYKNQDAVSVAAMPVAYTNFSKTVDVHGFVLSGNNVLVMPEAQGVIRSIRVSEGATVNKGQVLATIDTEIMRKNLNEAKKALELATEIFEKQKNLYDQKVGSEIQYLQAKNNKETLEERISTINSQISKATVTAPISGKVEKIYPKVGEMAGPGNPMIQIINTKVGAYIECDVSEAYYRTINKGDSVSLSFPTFSNEVVKTVISYKGNYINNSNRTFKIQVALDTKTKDYPANLFTIVTIHLERLDDKIVIPTNIIQKDDSGDFVYIVEEQKVTGKDKKNPKKKTVEVAVKRNIQISSTANNQSVISDGLKVGERIIFKAAWSKLVAGNEDAVKVYTGVKKM